MRREDEGYSIPPIDSWNGVKAISQYEKGTQQRFIANWIELAKTLNIPDYMAN